MQVSHITQVISKASLKFTNLNYFKMRSKDNKEYVHIIEPSDLKLRPIVAGPICPTRPLSNLIDIPLKPFFLYVKSYVKDNLDFLSK